MIASSAAENWYLWTAIASALLAAGAGLPRVLRGLGRFLRGVYNVIHLLVLFVQAIPELITLAPQFRQHAADDAAFQAWMLRALDLKSDDAPKATP